MSSPSALPIYLQTAEALARDIAAGRLLDGERLPPERDMAGRLGIAVGTLRKALAELQGRGLLERRQGSGNYVRHGDEATGLYAFFRLERADGGGGLPTADLLSLDRLEKPADLPDFGASGRAHRIRRLRRLDGRPAALEEIWLDAGAAPHLGASDLSDSLYFSYRQALGLWITRAVDRVGVAPVPDWRAAGFAPAPGTPCGHAERISHDRSGAAVEYSRSWFDPAVARYTVRLR